MTALDEDRARWPTRRWLPLRLVEARARAPRSPTIDARPEQAADAPARGAASQAGSGRGQREAVCLAGSDGCPAGPARCFWRISGVSRGVLQVLFRCWHGYVAPERTLPHAARPSPLVVAVALRRSLDSSLLNAAGEAPATPATRGQRRSWRALLRLSMRASPRRRRPECSRSSDSGVFSGSAAMPAPRAKPGRAGHDVSASLAATGLSTVVFKPFLSLAVR
jgi:hypothetical protein